MSKIANVFFLSGLAVTLGLVGCGDSGALPATSMDSDGGAAGTTGGGGPAGGGSAGTAGATGAGGAVTGGSGGSPGTAGRGGMGGAAAGGVGGAAAPGGAGGAASGGRGGTAGSGGAGGGGGAGACNIPSCLSDLVKDCQPMGACMSQTMGFDTRLCYANGYKQVTSISLMGAMPGLTITAYKPPGTAVCYTANAPIGGAPGAVMLTYRNPAGAGVATLSVMGGVTTITCNGQAPVTLNTAACGAQNPNPMMMMMGGTVCTPGVCM